MICTQSCNQQHARSVRPKRQRPSLRLRLLHALNTRTRTGRTLGRVLVRKQRRRTLDLEQSCCRLTLAPAHLHCACNFPCTAEAVIIITIIIVCHFEIMLLRRRVSTDRRRRKWFSTLRCGVHATSLSRFCCRT